MTMAPFNNAPETGTRNGRTAGRGAGAGALVGGAVFVSVIALCALVIAYNGIYRFALLVHEEGTFLAHVFPVTFTLLVLMAFWVSYVLRAAPPGERLWVDVVLIPLLIVAAAVPMVLNSMGLVESLGANQPKIVQVVVAVAPLAALLVAFLLWIAVRAHFRRHGNGARPRLKPSDDRATVLRSHTGTQVDEARVRDTREPEALKTRLLRLGADETDEDARSPEYAESAVGRVDPGIGGRTAAPEEREETRAQASGRTADTVDTSDEESPLPETAPLPTRISALRRDREEQREKKRLEREEREREAQERERAALEREERERADREEFERREAEEREEREHEEREHEWAAHEGAVRAPAETGPAGLDTAAGEPNDLTEASVPTLPLPRRARDGDNPIKRAATEPPVVPGAAAPVSEPGAAPETEDSTRDHDGYDTGAEQAVVVPDHLADEGFDHDSPVADPSTDEAEAPIPAPVAVEPRAEPRPGFESEFESDRERVSLSAREQGTAEEFDDTGAFDDTGGFDDTVELWPPEEAGADPLPEVEDLPREQEPEPASASADAADPAAGREPTVGAGALWEPPSDDTGPSSLADYVPPVWTPPEDDTHDGPAPLVGKATEATTPALDHDTGPEVRAAFRLGSVPPGAARPGPEPVAQRGPEPDPESESVAPRTPDGELEPEPVARREPEAEPKPVPEPEPVAQREPEPETERLTRPGPRTGEALRKRPMILKPKRPPMPDFASGPPSRRVRSEPLPPDEH